MVDNPASSHTAADDLFFLNGVDALTGGYLNPPIKAQDLLALARAEYEQTSPSDQQFAKALSEKISQPSLGFDVDRLDDPAEANWGVIWAAREDDGIKQAVQPLIKHRADQLHIKPIILEYRPDWTAVDLLAKYGVARGMGEVAKVPYYLLIVGQPSQIPFRVQYELDTEYAIGRLSFDSPQGYQAYVERLMDYESSNAVSNSRDMVLWATANQDDRATDLSSRLLAQPLYDGLNPTRGFNKQILSAAQATKANLAGILGRARSPALLFTASHGLGFNRADPGQEALQGALVTQEWTPGACIDEHNILAGRDVTQAANVRGMIHLAFACYGAGTPRNDDFAHGKSGIVPTIANRPFVSNLAQQMLLAGALAFVGHVERAWGYSFIGQKGESQPTGFSRAVDRLLRGIPAGHALRDLRDRAVQLASSLLEDLNDLDFGRNIPPLTIAEEWKERNDARAYILVGDPAARLRVQDLR